MSASLTRRRLPVLLAPLAGTALAVAVLVPLLPAPVPEVAARIERPAVQLAALPPVVRLDVPALVAEQRRLGLDCGVTSLRLPVCTHGGDEGLRSLPSLVTAAGGESGSTAGTRIGCYGDGRDGLRVQAVYARPEGSADRYGTVLPDLRRYAAGTDAAFDAAAQTTKGRRHLRFATTPSCELDVARVVLPAKAFGSMTSLVDALQVRGFERRATTYLVWSESTKLCGIATMYVDDSAGLDNLNNGGLPGYARVDRPCWGKAEVHELVHAFGGVQPSAPHSTGGYHCSDGADVMCYDDGTARSTQRSVCPASKVQVLDCRHDDYFSTAAPRGSYLQTHWNVARSSFLSASWGDAAPAAASSGSSSGPAVAGPAPAPAASPTGAPSASPAASASPSPSSPPPGPLGLPSLPALPSLPPLSTGVPMPGLVLPTPLTGSVLAARLSLLPLASRS